MSNQTLAKLWISRTKPTGKTQNMFFRDSMIFSYGEHFLIAKIDGNTVNLNASKYSQSTSRHQNIVKLTAMNAGFNILFHDNLKA
jgi:hypothetical protein